MLAKIVENPLIEADLKTSHNNIQTCYHQYLPWREALMKDNFKDLCEITRAVGE